MAWFDRWCATQLLDELDAIVCYENAALHTFQAAKEGGITTILDAASFHHQWQDAVYEPVETEDAHARINARKDREIALADHVLTVSELARGSYVEAGLPPERVTSVPMGADLSAFHPDGEGAKEETEPFTFIFAGQAGRRKGADLLLAASERLDQQGIPHRVQFAGSTDDELFVEIDAPVEPLGYLSRPALAAAFRRADCLVLPSRHDSFGRVVVEAMATGLPALVSENVGARDVITEETNGWVIPADSADALAVQMQWCVRHPDEAVAMQEAAVEAAEDFTWTAYRKRVTTVIDAILEGENTTLVASNARAFS
jgi:glycosyltransferase involved in cell wall biosynthesis